MNKFLEAALEYRLKYNWSVIPLSAGSKIPPKGFDVMQYRSRLADAEEIESWWADNPNYNIGIITGKLSNILAIDLDKYKPEYSEETVLQYIPDSIETVVDRSPRGGEHLYFQYPEDADLTINADALPAVDYRGEGGYILAPPSIFEGKASEWIVAPNGKPLACAPAALLRLLKRNINNKSTFSIGECKELTDTDLTNSYISNKSLHILQSGRRDQDLFTVANALIKNKVDSDFIKQVIGILADNCTPPFPKGEAEGKILSAIDRAKRKERNLTAEIRDFVTLQEGYFDLTFLYTTLQILTKDEKNNAMVIINRLCKDGLIEKYGNKRGCYIPIKEVEESIIDLSAADNTCLNIKFPLRIHDLVKIMPKNIIVVAGESNAGKTAMLLNIAAKNMIDHEVFYFSSEMGGAELKERLSNFTEAVPFELWKKCTFIERANDFDVAVRPNAINIIDFLEIHDEFYKIGGFIKKIFDKLDKGIAIIAIQKNKGRDDGLGGARSIEKARLYISMAPGVVKIIKAKNWVSSMVNPNGMSKRYKLAKGMIFKEDSDWERVDG